MTVASIRRVYQIWYENAKYKSFQVAMDHALVTIGLTDGFIESSQTQTKQRAVRQRLDIKDGVWGMITVEAAAIALLDCPIVQRLRRVKQLGFSYLVYPSAEHARFSHSLGVYHVARCYADEIGQRASDTQRLAEGLKFAKLSEQDRDDLLHAALLHDIGHMPFSHATEGIFHSADTEFRIAGISVRDFLLPVKRLGNIKLSEAMSIAIVLSPRFRKFYKAIRPNDDDAALRVALLIAGQRTKDENGALPELISSSIDADKIDYLLRDSKACNIPIGIDVSRLYLRSAFVEAQSNAVPEGIGPNRPHGRPFTLFCINSSGIDTLEEVALARTMLYQRVYTHRVTRNAERIVAKALFSVLDSLKADDASPMIDALEVWKSSDEEFLLNLEGPTHPKECRDMVDLIRKRYLPVRACAYGPALIAPLFPLKSVLDATLAARGVQSSLKVIHGGYAERLKGENLRGRLLQNLEADVLTESVRLRDFLVENSVPDQPTGSPDLVTILPLPDLGKKQYTGAVLEPHGEIASAKDYTRIQQITDAEELGKMVGYVHTSEAWAPLVALAFRNIVYANQFGQADLGVQDGELSFADDVNPSVSCKYITRFRMDIERICRRARVDLSKVENIHRELTEAGAYHSRPVLAAPYISNKAKSIAKRFEEFHGERGWRVTVDSVSAYMGQIRPDLREEMADLLADPNAITMLGRKRSVDLLERAIESFQHGQSGRRSFIAPLSPNSGNMMRMLLEQDLRSQLLSKGFTISHSITEVLGTANAEDSIFLCDDNVSSGSQSLAQFYRWSGKPRSAWPEDMRAETGIEDVALRENDAELLSKLKLGIVVCVQGQDANRNLKTGLEGLGIGEFLGIFSGENLASSAARFELMSDDLKDYLGEVGLSVLKHARRKEVSHEENEIALENACKRDSLGYSGAKGLLVTMFNVPTSTLPALWCPGLVHGDPWMPLFLRRGYLKHLVVA